MTLGRKPIAPSEYIGRKFGDRVVTGYTTDSGRVMFEVTCPDCKRVARYGRGKIVNAKWHTQCVCRNTGEGAPRVVRDYETEVGETVDGMRVTAFEISPRATYALRCPEGHTFRRDAWSVLNRGVTKCPDCPKSANVARLNERDECVTVPASVRPEVCDCTWLDGRQVRLCAQHRRSA